MRKKKTISRFLVAMMVTSLFSSFQLLYPQPVKAELMPPSGTTQLINDDFESSTDFIDYPTSSTPVQIADTGYSTKINNLSSPPTQNTNDFISINNADGVKFGSVNQSRALVLSDSNTSSSNIILGVTKPLPTPITQGNFNIEFDFAMNDVVDGNSNGNASLFRLLNNSGSTLIDLQIKNRKLAIGGVTNISSYKMTDKTWYHVKFNVNMDTLTYGVYQTPTGSGTDLGCNTGTLAQGATVSSIYLGTGGQYFPYQSVSGCSQLAYDNIQVYKSEAVTGIQKVEGDGTVSLSWPSVSGVTYYNVHRSESNAGPFVKISNSQITSAPTQAAPYVDSGLTNGKTYFYKVESVNNNGSTFSDSISATPSTPLDTPTLQVSQNDGVVSLEWASVTGAVYYNLYGMDNSDNVIETFKIDAPTTSLSISSGLTDGATYKFKVVAYSEHDTSHSDVSTLTYVKASPKWQSRIFGSSTDTTDNSITINPNNSVTLSSINSKGKISNTSDGIAYYYIPLDSSKPYQLTAKAHVDSFVTGDGQVSFGLMLRKTIGVDGTTTGHNSNFVAVGAYEQNMQAFWRGNEGGTSMVTTSIPIISPAPTPKPPSAGNEYTLRIIKRADGKCVVSIDSQVIEVDSGTFFTGVSEFYLGAFAARDAKVTFSDLQLVSGVESLELTSKPAKTQYFDGQDLDMTGSVISAVYSSNSKVVLSSDDYSITGYNKDSVGTQTVIVNFGGRTATFDVNVNEHQSDSDPVGPVTPIFVTGGDINVSTSGGTTTAAVTVNGVLNSDGTLNAALTASIVSQALKSLSASAGDSGNIVLENVVSGSDSASGLRLNLSASVLENLTEGSVSLLTFKTPLGTLSFDKAMLMQLEGQTDGALDISVQRVDPQSLSEDSRKLIGRRPVYDFSISTNGTIISDFGGGTVAVSLPYTLTEGEDPDNVVIYYISESGELISVPNCVYNADTGTVTFATNHFSVYSVGYNDVDFLDVSGWYERYVNFVAARGIMNGTGGVLFMPDATMTRAMAVAVLHRMSGDRNSYTNSFADVTSGAWYEAAIAWASSNGIVSGIGSGRFAPESPVTREQLAVMLYNYAKHRGYDVSVGENTNILSYVDALTISEYAYAAMQWTCGAGFIQGDPNTKLKPQDYSTRAEVASLLQRFLEDTVK